METPNSLEQYFPKTNLVEYSFCYEFMKKKKRVLPNEFWKSRIKQS